jgi:DNA-binding NtrC family response regulator
MLDTLISEMIARGVHYEDARREFDKRFLASVIDKCEGNLCKAADSLGMHRNTLARKVKELKIKARPSAS